MTHPIRITRAAWRDLEEICTWIADNDSPQNTIRVLDRLMETAESISKLPHRGTRPKELPAGLESEYRQVFFKPYRIIYEVARTEVVIHLIADGRRDLRSLVFRRLIGG
jgi:toxin ParE1/3/4